MDLGSLSFATPSPSLDYDVQSTCVVSLVDEETNSWKTHLIYSIFNPLIAATILQIPFTSSPYRDKLIWEEENNGKLSVRSAYKMIQIHMEAAKGDTSRSNEFNSFWRKLWHMKIPHKTKIFA